MASITWEPPKGSVPFGLLDEGQTFFPLEEDDDSVGYRKIAAVYEDDSEYNADCHNVALNSYDPNTRYRYFDHWTLVRPM